MWKNSAKISLYVGMLAGFVFTLQAFQGTFKTFWPGKQVQISKASKTFLTKVVPLEQELFAILSRFSIGNSHNYQQHLLALLQLSRSWSKYDTLQGADIHRFKQLVSSFKPIDGRIVDSKHVQQTQPIIGSIAQMIAIEMRHVYIATFQVDLQYVEQFLLQLHKEGFSSSSQSIVMQVFGIVIDIIHHFDGVSVTEYDFMVLSQAALFMQLLCSIK